MKRMFSYGTCAEYVVPAAKRSCHATVLRASHRTFVQFQLQTLVYAIYTYLKRKRAPVCVCVSMHRVYQKFTYFLPSGD